MTRRPLFIALFIALLLHGGVALWLMTFTKPPETKTEPTLKPPTVTITLAAMQPTITEPVIKKIVQPEVKPVIKTVKKTPVKPEPVLKPVTKPIAKPIPKPIEKPKPTPKPTVKPEPKPKPKLEPQKIYPPPISDAPEVKTKPEPTPPAQLPTPPVVSLSDAEAKQYQQQLSAWLNQYKNYPKRAKRMRIEGEGILRIEIDRIGQVQNITLKQSTGNRLLDKAALKTAQQASPFPKMPENDPRQRMEFEVPISFLLR